MSRAAAGARLSRAFLISVALLCGLYAGGAPMARAAVPTPPSGRWKAGTNYTVLSPAQPTGAPQGKVQVMEFFYLACPFCHALEPHLLAWRKTKPSYVQFVRVPVVWAPLQTADAKLFYTLEAIGRDDLVETAFDTLHRLEKAAGGNEKVMIGDSPGKTLALQEAFAERHGVAAAAFAKAYNSFDVLIELGRSRRLEQLYQITGTPTLVIDGRYETGPSHFHFRKGSAAYTSGDRRTIELINFLTRWVHDHPG